MQQGSDITIRGKEATKPHSKERCHNEQHALTYNEERKTNEAKLLRNLTRKDTLLKELGNAF